MVEIVPATQELADAYYRRVPHTFRGWAAVEDGRPLGFAGLYREGAHLVAFSDYAPEFRERPGHRKVMARGVRLVEKMMDEARRPVFAEANGHERTAPGLLRRLGFAPVHDNVLVRMPNA